MNQLGRLETGLMSMVLCDSVVRVSGYTTERLGETRLDVQTLSTPRYSQGKHTPNKKTGVNV